MSYRIVVADKDPRSREAVTRFLVQEDNEFINVSSSGELKEAIKNQKPDLIILNSVLADAPGWRLVQRIKGSRDFSNIPVLLMTGDPGGPPPAEVHSSGADRYLSKPIDGATLKETVEFLLGIRTDGPGGGDDEEIMIDFTDEDSGEMTEELLAMSNVALGHDEPSTDVGDTVEIDTGTLVAELDHTSEMAKDETYEDTVRLNLEDMGLEEEEAFEPTIELISDAPTDFADAGSSEVMEIDLDTEVALPDFETTTEEVTESEQGAKHSVTVEMDVDDLGLELESEEPIEEFSAKPPNHIDPDDTEIGQILDVQEPSRVLTSEDLMLDDDSLVRDASVSGEFDVIDLEEDSEIREIDMEELEAIHASDEEILGVDLDETVPVEDQEMELLANEDLQEIQLDDSEDLTLGVESESAVAPSYEATEELTLDEIGEEITTQEFFGEELPTEEFPTERFPEEKTSDLGLEEESLDYAETPSHEITLDQAPAAGEIPIEEITLDAASAEDILFDQTREEEPMLEVTEDISFDEISLEDEAEETPREKLAAASTASTAETIAGIAGGVLAGGVVAAAAGKLAGMAEKGEKHAQVSPPVAPVTEPQAPAAAEQEAMAPSLSKVSPEEKIEPVTRAFPGEELKETMRELAGALDSIREAQAASLPDKSEISETFKQAAQAALPTKQDFLGSIMQDLASSLPTKQDLLDGMMQDLASSLPTREDIFSRVDEIIGRSLPSEQEIAQRVDSAVQTALPSPEMIGERLEKVLSSMLSRDEIGKRFEEALGGLVSSDQLKEAVEGSLKAIPSQDFIKDRLDTAISTSISPELVAERVDLALRGMPSQEYIRIRLDNAFAALPSPDIVNERLNSALRAIPTEDLIMSRIDDSLQVLTSPDGAIARIDERLLSLLPPKDEIEGTFQRKLEKKIEGVLAGVDLKELVSALLPSTNRILETIKSALPEKDRFQESLGNGIAEAIQNSLPERVWLESVSRGLFDERTRGLLPKREEIVTMLREEIHLQLLDTVERVIREQIEKITSELS
ncbi:MAG: response regulator [Desulfomonilaceae bacterium]